VDTKTLNASAIRRGLLDWYQANARDLPWRRTRDPYRIWLSEVMLQQTRVAAVVPYYHRFLERFPDLKALAAASEQNVLTVWAGLGYYSRARNLHRAARQIRDTGAFPRDYESIRQLPGVGDYTAAAVASIAFGLPHPVLDGNVLRVLCRVVAEPGDLRFPRTRKSLAETAERLLDVAQPGQFNQALMELGATVCIPKRPLCELCPIVKHCGARKQALQDQLPIQSGRATPMRAGIQLLFIEKRGRLLLQQRPAESKRLAGFWELPESERIPGADVGEEIGAFRHIIVNTTYEVSVRRATLSKAPAGYHWIVGASLQTMPLSTISRKALARANSDSSRY